MNDLVLMYRNVHVCHLINQSYLNHIIVSPLKRISICNVYVM